MKLIRKISIGKEYKDNAMHYSVGQEVYGGHIICDIVEENDKFCVFIREGEDITSSTTSTSSRAHDEAADEDDTEIKFGELVGHNRHHILLILIQ